MLVKNGRKVLSKIKKRVIKYYGKAESAESHKRAKNVCIIDVNRGSLFKLSRYLYKEGVKPVMWMGYSGSKALPKVNAAYPDCEIYDYMRFNRGGTLFCNDLKFTPDEKLLLSKDFLILKDMSIKMMDRHDRSGSFRRQEREVLFYSLFSFFYSKIKEKDLELLISAHSPHLPATMVLYGVCKLLGVKTVHIREMPNAPFCYLSKDFYNGYLKASAKKSLIEKNLPLVVSEAEEIATAYKEPFYIIEQKEDYKAPEVNSERKTSYLELLKSKDYFSPPNASVKYIVDSVDFANDIPSVRYEGMLGDVNSIKSFKEMVSTLQWDEYSSLIDNVFLEEKFVYFPLHYEPEKTSNPDGGDYYNTYEAIMALRSFVPLHIPIYVKEHMTQFHNRYDGYKGRSPYFYRAIKNLPNIKIIDSDVSSRVLIENSLATVSQTGTACFEAACLGKKAILMGDIWFSSLVNVFRFNELEDFDSFLAKESFSNSEVVISIQDWVGKYCINGYVTGSFIRMHNRKHPENGGLSINDTCIEIVKTLKSNKYI